MIGFLVSAAIGGVSNRYRGGLFRNRDRLIAKIRPSWLRAAIAFLLRGDTVNAVAFGVFCAIIMASSYGGFVGGGPVYSFEALALSVFVVQAIMMYRAGTPGWGDYIGAAGGWRTDNLAEVEYIDQFLEDLRDRPRLWGVAGLSIRCAEWGLLIGAPLVGFIGFGALLPALAGATAGPIVWGLSKFLPRGPIWPLFEIIIGALFWGAIYLAI